MATFGFILGAPNKREVIFDAGDISKIKTQGVAFKLPEPVVVGSIDGSLEEMGKQFGFTPPTAAELPSPLKEVVDEITKASWTIKEFEIKLGPMKGEKWEKSFKVKVEARFATSKKLAGGYSVKGFVLGGSGEA